MEEVQAPAGVEAVSNHTLVMRVGVAVAAALTTFVAGKEGLRLETYLDYGGVPTACFGETLGIKPGMTFTKAQCEQMLADHLALTMKGVVECTRPEVPPGPLAAYTSFAYNVGVPAFCKSTMAKQARAGQFTLSCAQFDRWTFIGNKDCKVRSNMCNGIVIRRAEERALCEGINHG